MASFRSLKKTILVLPLSALLMVAGAGCSHHKTQNATEQAADSASPPDAGTDAVPQAAVEDRSGQPADAPQTATNDVPPPPAENQVPQDMNSSGPATPAPAEQPAAADTGSQGGSDYVVQQGDTLMKIAFDNYGDVYKWKDIYQANQGVISDANAVPPGTHLKLDPSERTSVAHNGSQYMIKSGDTLGTISDDVYGTTKKWKRLWDNNKQLIQDPNKIYAGFFLYYTLTPAEREDFKRRKGAEPPEEVHTSPLAEQTTPDAPVAANAHDTNRAISSVGQAMVVPPVQPAPPAQPEAPVPANETSTSSARSPASLLTPPAVQPVQTGNEAQSPAMQSLGAAPPPAEHSADLNEVIQQARKDEATAVAPAAAGP